MRNQDDQAPRIQTTVVGIPREANGAQEDRILTCLPIHLGRLMAASMVELMTVEDRMVDRVQGVRESGYQMGPSPGNGWSYVI
jgi:hypothetical protein